MWQIFLNPSCSIYKIDCVIIMFPDSCTNSQHIWIKYDILCRKTHLVYKNIIRPLAYLNFSFKCTCLTLLVKCHNHSSSSVSPNQFCTSFKLFLPLFQRNGVDNRFALRTLQAGFKYRPFRRIDHYRQTGNFRFGSH